MLGIETVSCRLLRRMARMVLDWKLKKLGQSFRVLMLCLQNNRKTVIMVSTPWWNFFDIFITLREHYDFVGQFCSEVIIILKSIIMTSEQNWPKTALYSWYGPFKNTCNLEELPLKLLKCLFLYENVFMYAVYPCFLFYPLLKYRDLCWSDKWIQMSLSSRLHGKRLWFSHR